MEWFSILTTVIITLIFYLLSLRLYHNVFLSISYALQSSNEFITNSCLSSFLFSKKFIKFQPVTNIVIDLSPIK